jgi:hypothetical protein
LQGVLVEELDATQGHRATTARQSFLLRQIQKVLAQFFLGDLVGRLAEVGRQLAHGAHIQLLRPRRVATELQILQQTLA